MLKFGHKLIILTVLFILCIICLTGCSKNENELLDEKILSELNYLENNIYEIVYKYASGEYEEKLLNDEIISNITESIESDALIDTSVLEMKVINFDKVNDDIKKVNNSLDVLLIDLSEKNIDTNMINKVSQNVNDLIVNVAENDINIVLRDVNEIEKNIINNIDKLSIEDSKKKIKRLKADILNVFIINTIFEDKTNSKQEIENIIKEFQDNLNDKYFVNDNQYIINNIYVLLQELKTAINSENEELIKIKYLSLMEIL